MMLGVRARLFGAVAAVLPSMVGLLVALVVGAVLILAFGQSPAAVYRLLLEGTWGNPYGIGQVLYKATTLTFTGLAVAVALRAGLFNIGAEGQLAAGAFVCALVGLVLPASAPWIIAVPLRVAGAAIGGGAVGALPGVLKARFGAHEVIVTIMMNFIVLGLLNWIVATRIHVVETLHTPPVHAGRVARLSEVLAAWHGSAANMTFYFAILAVVALTLVFQLTAFGLELRAVDLSPGASEANGISVGGTWVKAFALGGALAGIAGTNFVLGYEGYYEDGLAGGAGFMGIAVALVGRNHPVGVYVAALLFATLSQGGLAIHALIPKQLVEVLQAIVILALAAASPEARKALLELYTLRRGEEAAR